MNSNSDTSAILEQAGDEREVLPAVPGDKPGDEPWMHARPGVRDWAARFWIGRLMSVSQRWPWAARVSRPFWVAWAWHCSPVLRRGTTANARWLLGPASTVAQRRRMGRRVIDNFFRFIHDVARCRPMAPGQLRAMIDRTDGTGNYDDARRLGRGVIVATAHMGSFEVAMAALRDHDPGPIHVLFHADRLDQFQQLRHELHNKLNIHEVMLDRGWRAWADLRDALGRGEVVILQVDRLMPNQKGTPVEFCGGHVMLPTGAVRLAMLTGAPIVPAFSVRQADGQHRLIIEPPITVGSGDDRAALQRIAAVLEKHIVAHPEQWLMLTRVWCEDNEASP